MRLPNKMLKSHKTKKGISLLELMLVIIVITALTLGAVRYYTSARDNLRVTQAMKMISEVVGASYEWVKGQPSFADPSGAITMGKLVDAGLLPQKYILSNVNPWKGRIRVIGISGNLELRMENIPGAICENVLKLKVEKYAETAKGPECVSGSGQNRSVLVATFSSP